jgi:hypothetical protein
MGYDSKGILVFNLKYEHAISFINLVKFIIKCHGQYHRNCSQLRPVRLTCTDHRIIEILGLRSFKQVACLILTTLRTYIQCHIFIPVYLDWSLAFQ